MENGDEKQEVEEEMKKKNKKKEEEEEEENIIYNSLYSKMLHWKYSPRANGSGSLSVRQRG